MQRRRKSIIGLACLMSAMLLFSSCGKEAEEEKQDTQTQADTEKEEPKEKEGQGNLNIILRRRIAMWTVLPWNREHTFP